MLPLVLIAALGVGCVLYGVLIERHWYRVRRHRLEILPTGHHPPITILHLSDLHFLPEDKRKASFLASLPEADVTVITGDFLGEPAAVERVTQALRPVRGRAASWFVLGSNDYYVPRPLNYLAYFRRTRRRRWAKRGPAEALVTRLRADGWENLTNARDTVTLGEVPVEVLGLDDAHIRRQDYRIAPRTSPDAFAIAVMHSPDSAPEAAALGYDLLLAGHTHGGQVRLPFAGALVTNCSMPRRLVSGLIRMGPAILHTSRGLGTSKYAPFRFWCRPEVTLLELAPTPTAQARKQAGARLKGPRDVAQFGSAQRSGR